jgi:adenine-specific DNA-methyltransferase
MTLTDELAALLQQDERLLANGRILKNQVTELALKLDTGLLRLLLGHERLKAHFFIEVDGVLVFDRDKFVRFINNKAFLPDSYTSFKNKIGLATPDGRYLSQNRDVVLVWPYKDCVLEGGQTKEEQKREEIFWNEILAPDEIDRLLAPKVLTNWRRYDVDGDHDVTGLQENDNLILKGNNLLALASLKQRFAGKVKLIYIDPPYNTGNDSFGYNDRFNHSSWLTFMKNRLELARFLLHESGSIWINIDDDEAHYLKVLCDEVFGRENFIANVIWEKSDSPRMDAIFFSSRHDHILTFAKNKTNFTINRIKFSGDDVPTHYSKVDKDGRNYYLKPLRAMGQADSRSDRPTLYFPVVAPDDTVVFPIRQDGSEGRWRWSEERIRQEQDRIEWVKGKEGWVPYYRIYADTSSGRPPETIWTHQDVGSNRTSKAESTILFSTSEAFGTPKPEKLLQRIISIATNSDDIVLDFFAGSGTTAAVAHKMGRQFIAIEQMDYIETITVERLKKVIGYKEKSAGELLEKIIYDEGGISQAVGWEGGGSFVYAELMPWNEQFIDRLQAVEDKETLQAIWQEMQAQAHLSYRLDWQQFDENAGTFADLSFDDQRRFLLEMLDKNQLYVNLSEIDDETYTVSSQDKTLNRQFYRN